MSQFTGRSRGRVLLWPVTRGRGVTALLQILQMAQIFFPNLWSSAAAADGPIFFAAGWLGGWLRFWFPGHGGGL